MLCTAHIHAMSNNHVMLLYVWSTFVVNMAQTLGTWWQSVMRSTPSCYG